MLARAAKRLERGDIAGAVAELAKAWAEMPSTRIAKVAVALSARLPVDSLPAKVREREATWLKLAKTRDPGKLPTLLAAEWPVHPCEARARDITLFRGTIGS